MNSMKVSGMLAFGASLTIGAAAFGSDMGQNGGRSQVNLSDLRDKCTSIINNPQMVKPVVDLVCEQTQTIWKECGDSFDLNNNTQVKASVGMKDWMAYTPSSQDQANQHACSTFVKHQLTVKPVSQPMKCEDLLKTFTSDADLTAYCSTLIRDRVAQDPALQTDTATADTFSTCSNQFSKVRGNVQCADNQDQGKDQGQDQGQTQGNQSQGQDQGGTRIQGQGQDQGNQTQGQGNQSQGQGQGQDQGNQSQGQGQGNQSQGQGQGQDQGQGNQSQGQGSHDTSADAGF